MLNGYHASNGDIVCYKSEDYPNYMLWYQRVHLCFYCVLPCMILMILNTLLMRIIFASKKRLNNHDTRILLTKREQSGDGHQRNSFSLQFSSISSSKNKFNNTTRTIHRHSRKLTLSLIFVTLSYFVLTFPSTVIFSFIRPYIQELSLRRTLSLLFTNLSTTTHVIRFFIYYFCSIDFRNDFYHLFPLKRS